MYDQFDLPSIAERSRAEGNYTIGDMEDSDDPEVRRLGQRRADLNFGYGLNLDRVLETLLQHYGLYSPVLDLTSDLEIALFFATHKFIEDGERCSYRFVGTNGRNAVLYLSRDEENRNYERGRLLEELDPQRPKRQACVVVPTDPFSMNLPADLLLGVVHLDFDMHCPEAVKSQDIFPGPDEDPFLGALQRRLAKAVRGALTIF